MGCWRRWWRLYAVIWPFAGSYVDDAGHRHNNLWRFVELNSGRTADWDSLAYVAQYLGRTQDAGDGRVVPDHRRRCIAVGFCLAPQPESRPDRRRRGHRRDGRDHPDRRYAALPRDDPAFGAERRRRRLVRSSSSPCIGYIVLTAPRRPRVPQIAFLVVVAFLVSNKVDSPQYSLWLLPLAVLAYPRWRVLLAWQLVEIYEVVMRYLWFVYDDSTAFGKAGVPEGWFVSAVVLRQAGRARAGRADHSRHLPPGA